VAVLQRPLRHASLTAAIFDAIAFVFIALLLRPRKSTVAIPDTPAELDSETGRVTTALED